MSALSILILIVNYDECDQWHIIDISRDGRPEI